MKFLCAHFALLFLKRNVIEEIWVILSATGIFFYSGFFYRRGVRGRNLHFVCEDRVWGSNVVFIPISVVCWLILVSVCLFVCMFQVAVWAG